MTTDRSVIDCARRLAKRQALAVHKVRGADDYWLIDPELNCVLHSASVNLATLTGWLQEGWWIG